MLLFYVYVCDMVCNMAQCGGHRTTEEFSFHCEFWGSSIGRQASPKGPSCRIKYIVLVDTAWHGVVRWADSAHFCSAKLFHLFSRSFVIFLFQKRPKTSLKCWLCCTEQIDLRSTAFHGAVDSKNTFRLSGCELYMSSYTLGYASVFTVSNI